MASMEIHRTGSMDCTHCMNLDSIDCMEFHGSVAVHSMDIHRILTPIPWNSNPDTDSMEFHEIVAAHSMDFQRMNS